VSSCAVLTVTTNDFCVRLNVTASWISPTFTPRCSDSVRAIFPLLVLLEDAGFAEATRLVARGSCGASGECKERSHTTDSESSPIISAQQNANSGPDKHEVVESENVA
jgi:hypothetical protein